MVFSIYPVFFSVAKFGILWPSGNASNAKGVTLG